MEQFLNLVRKHFTRIDMCDMDDKTLEEMFFQNGPSRDECIKFLVYEHLLDIDIESDTKSEHDLCKIFVEFGLLDNETAKLFLNGNMNINQQLNCWKRILPAFKSAVLVSTPWPDYDTMINHTYQKLESLRSIAKKTLLPPELVPKLKNQEQKEESNVNFDVILSKVQNMLKKPTSCLSVQNENDNDNNTDNKLDLQSIHDEIAKYKKISENNPVIFPNVSTRKITVEEFIESINNQSIISSDVIESKFNDICRLIKEEQELQTLTQSLAK
ncbi:uncharacterized protein LOC126902940 [Daktulosphaira vitifoliae]|uniref:uncharacterized protein LOC126902940 n=1 Tax=Daktulosphaira vitifoliae TaxID=58002 RepID=UPI0021A9FC9E|nr:uncharacterized protein LOC126902940 [Daktulosphaira vitifoliae]XP_050536699.1 uncharacterized protein LOC126902940 [Daktulosphaira vitifoliae]XP_050536709.1 uncharacterized protein LOC126902940 [Daktulosphaira vitifoliae]